MTNGENFATQIEEMISTSAEVHSGITYDKVQKMMRDSGIDPNTDTAVGAKNKLLKDSLVPNLIITSSVTREMTGEAVRSLEGKPFVSALDSWAAIKVD